MMRDGHSPSSTSLLAERRITRAAKAHARNKALPRIDTEQLKSLSIREKHAVKHVARSSEADVRQQQFQKYCEFLWKTGRAYLGNKKSPHVNIAPVRLPTTPVSSYESTITIFTVVHSQGHSPIGLRRKFDRSLLNATVPEPSRSPSTPNFNREELLAAIVDTNKALTARRLRNGTKTVPSKRDTRLRRDLAPDGIPMHFPYARSYLPILASIIMSNQVRVGDTIELPLPCPEAWAETVAWVYTGEEGLVTDKVRENVQYLGGRIW
ncbi:uncharacterized protein BBA_01393 [Beauveria bassiana ARSEF 2860]|uniref:Uncharacterized protein n=1 Tax=Beauveria bassiana (strain ARSEF 2860) TaxID=655819 RepID=J5JY87_BEAB2|nr:uncharacterized protein BBA_01393 [Beauveria bassiana ARSEF 2860]EJP69428.1 hypothetical protein BBA_01393 [Beauveria bassiana ARSEF 2860]